MIFAWQEIPCENFALLSASPHNSFLRLYSQEICDLCDLHCFNNISLGFMEIEEASVYNKAMIKPISGTRDRMKRDIFSNAYLFQTPSRKILSQTQVLQTKQFQDDQFYKPRQISRLILICHENVASSLLFNLAGKVVRVSIDPMETDETRGDPSTRRLTT